MLANGTTKFMRRYRNNIAVMSLRLVAVVMFASLFAVSAGSVQAVSCYSDTWVDDSNSNQGSIVGCGVTQTSYNSRWSEFHEVSVDTTITSPNGRSMTVTATGEAGTTRTFSSRHIH